MNEVTVIDPRTGAVLSRKPIVNVVNFGRTGWVVNARGSGLTQFSY